MKKLFFSTLMMIFVGHSPMKSQIVTKQDTIGSTPLTVSMDKKVADLLENAEENCQKKQQYSSQGKSNNTDSSSPRQTIKIANRELTTAEVCRQTPKIRGVKIQLVVVKSNAQANEVKAYFRRHFPSIKTQTDASLRPNYKILAGSYFTRQSAAADLAKIRKVFKEATLVDYMIYCVEGK